MVSLFWREPFANLILLSEFKVKAHFFFEVRVELPATKQHPKASSQFAQKIHKTVPFKLSESRG